MVVSDTLNKSVPHRLWTLHDNLLKVVQREVLQNDHRSVVFQNLLIILTQRFDNRNAALPCEMSLLVSALLAVLQEDLLDRVFELGAVGWELEVFLRINRIVGEAEDFTTASEVVDENLKVN